MDDYFPSEESEIEPEGIDDVNEQKKYLKKLQTECLKYDDMIKELNKEKDEREEFLQKIQGEIEELQRDILYHDLNIEKAMNVYAELDDLGKEKTVLDKAEQQNEMDKLDHEITKNLTKYINRVMYTKKVEFEDKIEKKKNNFQAVCIKFYKDDPTNEEYGQYHTQSYSFQVFGLSNDLTFQQLMNLAKEHWKITNIENFVLTDPDHHDMVLLSQVPIVQYLTHENTGHALFVLRPKNVKMRELVSTQKVGITLVQENEKQSKLKEEFNKIFALLRKAKPGIKTYERIIEEHEHEGSPIDGTIFNFALLLTVLILMILSLTRGGIQPADQRELNKFTVNVDPPSFFSSPDEFHAIVVPLLYDLNPTTNLPINYHYVPVGVKRIIMNKMRPDRCNTFKGQYFCAYNDVFLDSNKDTSPLTNTTEGSWKNYTIVPEHQQVNMEGEASFFKGDGFIYDFPIDKSQTQAQDLVVDILKNGTIGNYFSENSRAYVFTSMYFEPNRHIILERAILFEFMSSGIIEVTDRKTYFKPDSADGNQSDTHSKIDLALLIITIVGYVINIILNVYKTKSKKEFIVLRNLIKYVIVALVIAFYAYMYQQPDVPLETIISSNTFMTFYKYGIKRQTALNCLTLAFFLHSLTMIRSFVFSRTVNVFLNIFAQSYKDFLAFLLIFFATFIGFSFVWWIAFGPYHQNLQSLTNTAFEIFLYFATGNTIIINILYQINEGWAILLVIMTCFIIFIQLDALMMSLIQENVRYLYLKSKPASAEKLPFREAVDKIIARANAIKARAQNFLGRFKSKRA